MIITHRIAKILFISVFLVLCISLVCRANQDIEVDKSRYYKKIEGTVVDEHGHWVESADVIIPEKGAVAKTGRTGKFLIEFQGGGSIHIEVFKEGFMPAATKVFRISRRVHIKYEPDIVLYRSMMEEVVVTGTATPKLYRETPVKTFIADKEAIENKGAQNLADSLEIVTGVRVEDNCQNCNFTQVRINGMEGKYTQILLNGMPMVSSLAGVYALEQIPANMIEKFEVVKGGGSSLYGGNAVGGVVNVMLREPEKSGSHLLINQGFVGGEPNTNVSFNYDYVGNGAGTQASFFSNFQRREPMDYNDDGFSDLGKLANLSLGSNLNHYFNRINGKLKMSFAAISEDRRGGNKFDVPEHFADIAESIRTRRLDFTVGWEQTFSKTSVLKINGAYTYTKRKTYYGAEQDANAYGNTTNPMFYGEAQYHNFSLSHHAIVIGASLKYDKIDDSAPAYNRTINETYTDIGFYLQDEIKLGNCWKLLIGARADKHSEIEKVIISPRTSIGFTGLKDFTFRFTYSTGFRAPQVFDEDLHITQVGGEGMIIRNRDGLKEESSYSFTFGVDFGKQVAKKLYRFSIGGFYNRLNDVFVLDEVDTNDDFMVMERFNSDGARVYGLEIEAGFKASWGFEIFTGWTLQRSEYDTPEPDFNSRQMFRAPDLYGTLRIVWMIKHFLDLNVELNYTGSMKVPHYAGYIPDDILEETAPFTVVNLKLSKKMKTSSKESFTVSAAVFNVFDRFQKDLDKGIYRDAGYIYGPRIPRTFRLGIKYSF